MLRLAAEPARRARAALVALAFVFLFSAAASSSIDSPTTMRAYAAEAVRTAVHEPTMGIDMDASSYVPAIAVELEAASIAGPDFDGRTYFYPQSNDLCVIPEVFGALGFRASFGVRRIDPPLHFLGVTYALSRHDAEWLGFPQDVLSQTITVGGKLISDQPWPVRPYVSAAFGSRWLRVGDAHYHGGSPGAYVADLTLQGFGGEVGVGAEYPVSDRVTLTAALRGEAFWEPHAGSNGPGNLSFTLNGLLSRGLRVSGGVEFLLPF
jgi:hypothetical protein